MKNTSQLIKSAGAAIETVGGICNAPLGVRGDGVAAGSLKAARIAYADLPAAGFAELEQDTDGVFVLIPQGVKATEPVALVFSGVSADGANKGAVVVVAQAGSSAELVLLLSGNLSTTVRVAVGEGAELKINEVLLSDADERQESDCLLKVEADARVETVTVELGAGQTDMKYRTELLGRSADTKHAGIFIAADGEQKNIDVRVEHLVPDCRSDVMIKGVASGTGRGSFSGMVYVARDAQHTEAYQQSRNLLIGEKARILTSPQLEIYADDVKCSHGATVGQMSDDAVYYMCQRGLDESEARGLQLAGFVNDIILRLGAGELTEQVLAAAEEKITRLQ